MKKYLIFIIISLSIITYGCKESTDSLEKVKNSGKIIIGTEGTYPPFTYHDSTTNELTGFDVDIALEVAKRLGVEAVFLETAWDGLLTGVNTGRYDVVANQVWKKPQREEAFTLTDNYMRSRAVIVSRIDSKHEDLSDVAGKKAGHSLTSAYADISREAGAEIVGVDTFTLAVENLKNGRIDYTINDTETAAFHLANNPEDTLYAVNLASDSDPEIVMALSKTKGVALAAQINKAIKAIKADGTYDKIYSKYFKL